MIGNRVPGQRESRSVEAVVRCSRDVTQRFALFVLIRNGQVFVTPWEPYFTVAVDGPQRWRGPLPGVRINRFTCACRH